MFMTPDQRRLTFYDGEVRPGESAMKVFDLECAGGRACLRARQVQPDLHGHPEQSATALQQLVADGMPQRPLLELIVPVTVIG